MTGHIADGMNSLNVYISLNDAAAAIDWYVANLGAVERMRLPGPGGHGVMHAELDVGGTVLMLSDANPDWGTAAPGDGPSVFSLMLYVPDCDAVLATCKAAGAIETMPAVDQFWGDRSGRIRDPFGHSWMIATHQETVEAEEIGRRFTKMMAGESWR